MAQPLRRAAAALALAAPVAATAGIVFLGPAAPAGPVRPAAWRAHSVFLPARPASFGAAREILARASRGGQRTVAPTTLTPVALPHAAPQPAMRVESVLAPAGATFSGDASWYGPGFAGRHTASGETFDPSSLTAASRTLPFGTLLRVCRDVVCVVVRVNDRGPYVGDRILDLSSAAAGQLGYSGVTYVTATPVVATTVRVPIVAPTAAAAPVPGLVQAAPPFAARRPVLLAGMLRTTTDVSQLATRDGEIRPSGLLRLAVLLLAASLLGAAGYLARRAPRATAVSAARVIARWSALLGAPSPSLARSPR